MSGTAPNPTTLSAPQPSTNILQPWSAQQLQVDAAANAVLFGKGMQSGTRYQQQVYQTTVTPVYGVAQTINLPLTPVGLQLKYIIEATTVVTNPSSGSTLTRASFGPFATFSQIQYTDPATNNRIVTPGWHLATVVGRRHRRIPGSALTTDSPTGYGSVIQPIAAPSTIAANASGTVRAVYEVPLAFQRKSAKGAVFAGSALTTQQLQVTFNANFAQNGTDPININGVVYTGASNTNPPTYSTTITVWIEYMDNFDLGLLQLLTPSLSTSYNIKLTGLNTVTANADNFIRFSNLQEFHSVTAVFDNGGTLNAGTDINYFMLQSANQTTLWKRDAYLQSYMTRNGFSDDLPAGAYLFDFGEDPIITAADGNTVLSVNPSSAQSGAVLLVGWEFLATQQVLASAPSLSGNFGTQ
jgi:hypothetical protein